MIEKKITSMNPKYVEEMITRASKFLIDEDQELDDSENIEG